MYIKISPFACENNFPTTCDTNFKVHDERKENEHTHFLWTHARVCECAIHHSEKKHSKWMSLFGIAISKHKNDVFMLWIW